MLDISQDIHSLSSFKRNTSHFVRQMKKAGRPVVLTINGKAELVVQDAAAYQKLLDLLERLETVQAIREGLEDVDNGRTRPAREALEDIRQKHGIPR